LGLTGIVTDMTSLELECANGRFTTSVWPRRLKSACSSDAHLWVLVAERSSDCFSRRSTRLLPAPSSPAPQWRSCSFAGAGSLPTACHPSSRPVISARHLCNLTAEKADCLILQVLVAPVEPAVAAGCSLALVFVRRCWICASGPTVMLGANAAVSSTSSRWGAS